MKKKIFLLTVSTAMSFAMLTGCGTPKADKLAETMFESEISSADINILADIDVSAEIDGEEYSATVTADMDIQGQDIDSDEPVLYYKGKLDYNLADILDDSLKLEAYVKIDGDEITYYENEDDCWYYSESTSEDYGVDVDKDARDAAKAALKDLLATGTVDKKTVDIEGEDSYVLTVNPTGEQYVDFLDEISKAADAEDEMDDLKDSIQEEYDIELEELFDALDVSYTFYVSKKNGYCTGAVIDFSTIDIEALLEIAGQDYDSIGELMGVELDNVEIGALSVTITLSDINDMEVKIPEEVEDEAIDADAAYDYEDDYDDDYDEDDYDDDYDYSEDDFDDEDDYDVDYYDDEDDGVVRYTDSSIDLYDYDDEYLITLYVPDDFYVDEDYLSEDGYYYGFENDDYDEYYISSNSDYEILDFINNGTVPEDNEYITDYALSSETYEIADQEIICVREDYSIDGTEYSSYYFLLCQYENSWDETDYVQIECPDFVEDWDEEDVENFFCEILNY